MYQERTALRLRRPTAARSLPRCRQRRRGATRSERPLCGGDFQKANGRSWGRQRTLSMSWVPVDHGGAQIACAARAQALLRRSYPITLPALRGFVRYFSFRQSAGREVIGPIRVSPKRGGVDAELGGKGCGLYERGDLEEVGKNPKALLQ